MPPSQLDNSPLYSLVSFLLRSSALKNAYIVGDTRAGSELISAAEFAQRLHPLAPLFTAFNCKVEGFKEYPELVQRLQCLATDHQEFYQTNVLHYATLVRDESEAYKAVTDICNDNSNLHQHLKLRSRTFNTFNQSFDQHEDESQLLAWADETAEFLTRMFNEEAKPALKRASGFWLAALKRFETANKNRFQHFPGRIGEQ
jgi:IS1 family transposase